MPSERAGSSPGYLHGVLADGARPFQYRSRLRRLLGLPEDVTQVATGARVVPPLDFAYLRNVLSGDIYLDELLSAPPAPTVTYIEEDAPGWEETSRRLSDDVPPVHAVPREHPRTAGQLAQAMPPAAPHAGAAAQEASRPAGGGPGTASAPTSHKPDGAARQDGRWGTVTSLSIPGTTAAAQTPALLAAPESRAAVAARPSPADLTPPAPVPPASTLAAAPESGRAAVTVQPPATPEGAASKRPVVSPVPAAAKDWPAQPPPAGPPRPAATAPAARRPVPPAGDPVEKSTAVAPPVQPALQTQPVLTVRGRRSASVPPATGELEMPARSAPVRPAPGRAVEQGWTSTPAVQPALLAPPPAAPPAAPPIIIRQTAQAPATPAFWERSHLSRLRARILR